MAQNLDDKARNLNDKLDRDVSADGVDRNPDPITGAPGSHPTGVGIGSASGAATGAALGSIGGPIGAIIGGVAGAVVGGYTGKAAGEWNDPTEDESYWRNNYTDRPYVKKGDTYDTYADSYRYGSTAARAYPDRPFVEVEDDVRTDYANHPAAATTPYESARPAIEDAYTRAAAQRAARLRRDDDSIGSTHGSSL